MIAELLSIIAIVLIAIIWIRLEILAVRVRRVEFVHEEVLRPRTHDLGNDLLMSFSDIDHLQTRVERLERQEDAK